MLGCRTLLRILFGILRQFLKVTFWIFWPNYWFYIKILFCKVVDLAKIMEPSWTTFLCKTNSLASNMAVDLFKFTVTSFWKSKIYFCSRVSGSLCDSIFEAWPGLKKTRQVFFKKKRLWRVFKFFFFWFIYPFVIKLFFFKWKKLANIRTLYGIYAYLWKTVIDKLRPIVIFLQWHPCEISILLSIEKNYFFLF